MWTACLFTISRYNFHNYDLRFGRLYPEKKYLHIMYNSTFEHKFMGRRCVNYASKLNMSGSPNRSLAVIGSLGSLGLLWPPLLTARTLNWYFIPSTRSGTLASHLFPMTSTAFCHLELEIILKYSKPHIT
jgi:hypothetical protein